MILSKLKKWLVNLPIFRDRYCFILLDTYEEYGRQDFFVLTKEQVNSFENEGLIENGKLYRAKFIKEYKS